jgi:hypothetical protein
MPVPRGEDLNGPRGLDPPPVIGQGGFLTLSARSNKLSRDAVQDGIHIGQAEVSALGFLPTVRECRATGTDMTGLAAKGRKGPNSNSSSVELPR